MSYELVYILQHFGTEVFFTRRIGVGVHGETRHLKASELIAHTGGFLLLMAFDKFGCFRIFVR